MYSCSKIVRPRARSCRTVSTSVTCAPPARAPAAQAGLAAGTRSQVGRSATSSTPNVAPGASTRATACSVAVRSRFAQQRLQHAVRRHHEAERRRGGERQRADVAANQMAHVRGSRPRRTRCRARASMASDRSMPTTGTPARASGSEMRPGAASELEHRPGRARAPALARTARRAGRACARSPSRRTARSRPSPPSPRQQRRQTSFAIRNAEFGVPN